jgi:hypothetical protein
MEARHAYIKGLRGNGIFYRSEDFIVLITIVSVLVKKAGMKVMAFCPMFNHIHFLIKKISLNDLRRFIQRLAIIFVKEYNNEYGRKGTVFQKPFGCSLKRTIKIIMGCVAYVFNNPVAAKLSRAAREYRWSLYAYHNNKNPYSEPLKKETCRNKMRVALKKVDYFHAKGQYLSYATLRDIFEYLNQKEHLQMIDYILSKYYFLSKESLEELYGSFSRMLIAVDSNAGAEFELEDDYGDHSVYRKMLGTVMKYGYTDQKLNFESLPRKEVGRLYKLLSERTRAPRDSINRFLHCDF